MAMYVTHSDVRKFFADTFGIIVIAGCRGVAKLRNCFGCAFIA